MVNEDKEAKIKSLMPTESPSQRGIIDLEKIFGEIDKDELFVTLDKMYESEDLQTRTRLPRKLMMPLVRVKAYIYLLRFLLPEDADMLDNMLVDYYKNMISLQGKGRTELFNTLQYHETREEKPSFWSKISPFKPRY